MRSSTPATTRPVIARQSTSSGDAMSTDAGACETAASGDVSVMPQPWTMRTPYRSINPSISARGTAEPPQMIMRSVERSISCASP